MIDKEFFRGCFVWLMKAISVLPVFLNHNHATVFSAQIEAMKDLKAFFNGGDAISLAKADQEIRDFKKVLTENKMLSLSQATKFIDCLATSATMLWHIGQPKIRDEAKEMFFMGLKHPREFRSAFHNGQPEVVKWLNHGEIMEKFEQLKGKIG